MAYTIYLTNGDPLCSIPDGTINTQTAMTLVGKNFAGYGQYLDTNFARLLESNASNIAPSTPLTGQLWFNTAANSMQVYDGTGFKTISGTTSSSTAPSGPSVGDLWYDTANGQLKIWDGSSWVVVGPQTTFDSLGVGTAAPTLPGGFGEIRATNNITAFYSSDSKFKTNVADISDATAKVQAIGGKTFDWTEEYLAAHGGEDNYFYQKNDYGVIAQDVQAVFPTAVRTREDGSLAIDYGRLSALALASIKELVVRIEALEAKTK